MVKALEKTLEKRWKNENKENACKRVFPIGADTHFAIGFVRFSTSQIFMFGYLNHFSVFARV